MLTRRRLGALAAAAVVAVAPVSSCALRAEAGDQRLCAIMPDAVGLYPGNPVTQMGYRIGTVSALTPAATTVRVDFTVTAERAIPADAKAVIRSMSVLADRSLELVGNYTDGPTLGADTCIPLQRSATPKSLSQIVASMGEFLDAVSPPGSDDVADTVAALDAMLAGQGGRAAELATRLSALLDSPDRAISDTGSIVTNFARLTTEIARVRGTLKQVLLDAAATTADLQIATDGVRRMTAVLPLMVGMVADLERELGDQTQQVLDTVSVALRKLSPHATAIAGILSPIPGWLAGVGDRFSDQGLQLKWRPPLYRIRTPDGLLLCGQMNARVPGSCADVAGTPYAVDVALLQYVLTEASRR
ncbi:MCE family protein [Mycolicibacillus parakoreensis]|uniref:MlaD family protein n=1 Tax=Mycolicibacillus parakoreensis TaxID=1069221 RepID=A0ABY3U0V7_9MYCO|nr:MlaD family protein [Mycolicibacillus parakoreensis]MCV7316534.1 MCE family protein [Mycolicibacillus parakoreensis]ULN52759.1 MlaD family protein [Mycolicibacillus parakoreensis]HLR98357.1 MlaD family protein [Mycolicibacillus parakoreensis]